MKITGKLMEFDRENLNGRIYPSSCLEKIDFQKEYLGEFEQPDSTMVNLGNVSHKVTNLRMDGNSLYGDIEILSTPQGKIVKDLLESGCELGIGSRSTGTVDGNGVVTLKKLHSFDIVSNPGFEGAVISLNKDEEWVDCSEDVDDLFEELDD